jgi:hypothetical protein
MEENNDDIEEVIRIEDEAIENSEEIQEQMMVIEINFGPGKCDEILVHYGDDITELAETFVYKHGLKKSAVSIIEKHIDSTIEEFLSKNEDYQEEDDDDDEDDEEEESSEQQQYEVTKEIEQQVDDEIIYEIVKEIINEIIHVENHNG